MGERGYEWYNLFMSRYWPIFVSDTRPTSLANGIRFHYNPKNNSLNYYDALNDSWTTVSFLATDPDNGDNGNETININDYLKIVDAANTYLTIEDAADQYLPIDQSGTTFEIINNGGFEYLVSGFTQNFPTLTLIRGFTYVFDVSDVSTAHPFALRLSNLDLSEVPGTINNDPANGRTTNSESTKIIYKVPFDAPDSIVYQCTFHASMIGQIVIGDILTEDQINNLYISKAEANSLFVPAINPTFTGNVTLPSTTIIGDVSATEISYLDGVTSSIQQQLSSKIGYTVREISASAVAANNDQILANSSAQEFTITLPIAPFVGSYVYIVDAANTFNTKPVTVTAAGNKIEGSTQDLKLNVRGASVALYYVSDTIGWKVI